jgi:transposase InsO family protein
LITVPSPPAYGDTIDDRFAADLPGLAPGGRASPRAWGEFKRHFWGRSLRYQHTANETLAFAHAIRLVPCFTPVRSPQSNGIAEAFVKTFKRDYVRLSARPDATALLAELDRWFEDHNEMHPHRARGMRSPRDFIRAHQRATCPV